MIEMNYLNRDQIVQEILKELDRAVQKYPLWPSNAMHAIGPFNEEVGELNQALFQRVYEPWKNNDHEQVKKEATQAAAMAIRFLMSVDIYDYIQSSQHSQ